MVVVGARDMALVVEVMLRILQLVLAFLEYVWWRV